MFIRKPGKTFTGKRVCYALITVLSVLFLASTLFATGAPEKEEDMYDKYAASVPQGCEPVPRECFEQAVAGKTFAMYDWAAWWPEELYEGFSKEFGIEIVRDNYPDLDTALAKFRLNPDTPYDYFLANPKSLWYLREQGNLHEVNHDWIPNANKYMQEEIKSASWDPGYKHCVLTTLGFDAYVINSNFIDKNDPRIPSWKFVFEGGKAYQGKLVMRNEMNRVIGNALKYLGYSLNSTNEKELAEAKKVLLRLQPYIMAFDSWPKRAVLAQEVWVVEGVVHDYLYLGGLIPEGNPFIAAYPPEGCLLSPMLITIPKGGGNPAATHCFINYLYRPENFAKLINATAYGHGHTAVDDLLTEDVKKWMVPPKGYLKKCEVLTPASFTGIGEKMRADIWKELKK
ncbi:MAG: extracellular solute-binding protein [Spirochaetes bacterium]|nr:extracellular solute-binding protein [Spirochaetota bacterium]